MKPTRTILKGDKELAATHSGDSKRVMFQLKNIQKTNDNVKILIKEYNDGTKIKIDTSMKDMDVIEIESGKQERKYEWVLETQYQTEEVVPIVELSKSKYSYAPVGFAVFTQDWKKDIGWTDKVGENKTDEKGIKGDIPGVNGGDTYRTGWCDISSSSDVTNGDTRIVTESHIIQLPRLDQSSLAYNDDDSPYTCFWTYSLEAYSGYCDGTPGSPGPPPSEYYADFPDCVWTVCGDARCRDITGLFASVILGFTNIPTNDPTHPIDFAPYGVRYSDTWPENFTVSFSYITFNSYKDVIIAYPCDEGSYVLIDNNEFTWETHGDYKWQVFGVLWDAWATIGYNISDSPPCIEPAPRKDSWKSGTAIIWQNGIYINDDKERFLIGISLVDDPEFEYSYGWRETRRYARPLTGLDLPIFIDPDNLTPTAAMMCEGNDNAFDWPPYDNVYLDPPHIGKRSDIAAPSTAVIRTKGGTYKVCDEFVEVVDYIWGNVETTGFVRDCSGFVDLGIFPKKQSVDYDKDDDLVYVYTNAMSIAPGSDYRECRYGIIIDGEQKQSEPMAYIAEETNHHITALGEFSSDNGTFYTTDYVRVGLNKSSVKIYRKNYL